MVDWCTMLRTGSTTFVMVPNYGRHPYRQRTQIGPVAADDPTKALVYCARGSDVDTVIVGGVTRVQDGIVPGVDYRAQRDAAERFNRRLRASAGRATYPGRSLLELYGSAFPDRQS